PLTQRRTPAPLITSERLPTFAPAPSNSASETEAAAPAPVSRATSAPSAMNFFTVSGIAAQRVSPAASFSTAIFMRRESLRFEDQEDDEPNGKAGKGAPLQQSRKAFVITNMDCDVLGGRAHQQRFLFSHTFLLSGFTLGRP